ncbi:MAG: AIPR family protein [Chloroflexi bacterium]|nr:AIPR family protein [Chloroflexota bacterium]
MDYAKQIRDEISVIAKEENLSNDKAFIIWVLEQYFNLSREEDAYIMTDSSGDKRIDAFIESDDVVRIVQCKLYDDETKEVGEKEIVVFKGCLDWLTQPNEIQKLNLPKLFDAATTFFEKWNEGASVELHYFAFGKFCEDAYRERRVFNSSDLRDRVQMHFHDISDLLNVFQANLQLVNPLASEEVILNISKKEFFLRQDGPFPALVISIKGRDLASLYNKYGDRLFERNIRLFKGIRKGSINAEIINTVLDESERKKFWYYNNGISFVCSGFSFDDEKNPSKVTITGPQIINGCQTTACLKEAGNQLGKLKLIPADVDVLARFIKAPVNSVEFIALYTNSQNPVSEAQLKSNDPIQKRLKKDFDNYSLPWFYSTKEGDWKTLSKDDKQRYDSRIIDLIKGAQAIYAFLKDPAFARRYRIDLFSKKYHEIFKKDTRVEEVLLPWRILSFIDNEISKYRKDEFNKLKLSPGAFNESQKEAILRKEFLLYSNLIILHFIHNLIKKRYGEYNPEIASKLLNNQLETRIKTLFDYIVAVLSFSDKLSKERNLTRFLKSLPNIQLLYSEIEKEIEKDKATKQDILTKTLPNI